MSRTARLLLVALLWCAALLPPALMAVSLWSPPAAVSVAWWGSRIAWNVLGWSAVAFAFAALVWPPFLPGLRVRARRLAGRMSTNKNQLRDALARLAHLETAQSHLEVARLAHQLGNARQALPHAVKAVEIDPELLSARFTLAQVLDEVGQRKEAIRQCRIVLRDDPDHAFGKAQQALGEMLLRDGQVEDAIAALTAHAKIHSANRSSAFSLASAYQRAGNKAEAARWFGEAARNPREGESLSAEDALVRARARGRLWGRGAPRPSADANGPGGQP